MSRTSLSSTGVIVLIAALVLVPATAAEAAWTTGAGGSSAGAATVMPTGAEPSGVASGTSVTVNWAGATLPNGTAVAGYTIERYNSTTGVGTPATGGCSGTVTTNSCVETSVPAGTWTYVDTPVQGSWTGTQSPPSPTVTVSSGRQLEAAGTGSGAVAPTDPGGTGETE